MKTAAEVLAYWFGPGMDQRWFNGGPEFDTEVRDRLGPVHVQAATGRLESWRDSARGCLALVILLDQVPRNIHRNSPQAYASDAQARELTRWALERGFEQELSQLEQLFLYLPLEHSETLSDQHDCVTLIGQLDQNPQWVTWAEQHRDIIAKFGRFPHRNDCLGRPSTAEETAFLATPNSSF